VYFGLSLKLNDLLSDFGRQKPSPPGSRSQTTAPSVSN
jgi:hypothetical protein